MMLTNYGLHYNNHTYRLFLMSLFYDEESSPIQLIRGLECFFLLPTVLLAWYAVVQLPKTHLYHANIVRIIQFNYLCVYLASAARIALFLYKIGLFPLTYTVSDWPLILASVVRLQFTSIFIFLHLMVIGILLTFLVIGALWISAESVIFNDMNSEEAIFYGALFETYISASIAITMVSFEIVNSQFKKGNLAIIGTTPTQYAIQIHIERSKMDEAQMHFDVLERFW